MFKSFSTAMVVVLALVMLFWTTAEANIPTDARVEQDLVFVAVLPAAGGSTETVTPEDHPLVEEGPYTFAGVFDLKTIGDMSVVPLLFETDGVTEDGNSLHNLVVADNGEIRAEGLQFTAHLIDGFQRIQKSGTTGVCVITPQTFDTGLKSETEIQVGNDVYADMAMTIGRTINEYMSALAMDTPDTSGEITAGQKLTALGTDDASAGEYILGESILDVIKDDTLGAEDEVRQVDVSVVVSQIEPAAMRLLLFEELVTADTLSTTREMAEHGLFIADDTFLDAGLDASPYHVEVPGIVEDGEDGDSALATRHDGVDAILKTHTDAIIGFENGTNFAEFHTAVQVDEVKLQRITAVGAGHIFRV